MTDMHIIEQAVKLLCEKSQRPHDDFDIMGQKLGSFGDEYMYHRSVNKDYDHDIAELAKSIMGQGTLIVETFNEGVFVKLMELRGTPIEWEENSRDIDFDYQQYLDNKI